MSAADIITYFGVPLAVLGVLPILYTTFTTFVSLRLIHRLLKQNHTTALIRASFVSGFIELTFSRTALTPLSREDKGYWEPRTEHVRQVHPYAAVDEVANAVSALPGAGWTKFQWRTRVAGSKTYRLQRVEEIRTPQAEIDLGELVRFLVDRGAVVERRGWETLRRAGMWTPAGTKLLTTYNAHHTGSSSTSVENAVLSVSVPEESDGVLSLNIKWDSEWGRGREESEAMPPGWTAVRKRTWISVHEEEAQSQMKHIEASEDNEVAQSKESSSTAGADSANGKTIDETTANFLDLQLAPWGLSGARTRNVSTTYKLDSSSTTPIDVSRFITEQSSSSARTDTKINPSLWISSAATALNGTSPTQNPSPLWPHSISPILSHFAMKPSIPVGLLVVLELLPNNAAPAWELSVEQDDHLFWQKKMRKMQDDAEEDARIRRMPEAERKAAQMAKQSRRARDFHHQFLQENEDKRLKEERRNREALNSTKWAAQAVAETCAAWLAGDVEKGQQVLPKGSGIREAVEKVLWDSVVIPGKEMTTKQADETTNGEKESNGTPRKETISEKVSDMLQMWKGWTEQGGLTRGDLDTLRETKEVFAYAACVLATIGAFSGSDAEKTSEDVRECIRVWPVVRVG